MRAFADGVHPGYAAAGIATDVNVNVRPGGAQAGDDVFEIVIAEAFRRLILKSGGA